MPFDGVAGTYVELLNWAAGRKVVHPRPQKGPETPAPFPYLPSTPQEVPLAYLEVVGLQPGDCYGTKVTVDDRPLPGEPSVLPASRAMMRSAARAQLAEYVAIHWEERSPCVTTTCWRLYGNTGRPRTPTTSTGSTESTEMTQYLSFAVCPVLLVLCERYLWRDRRVAVIRR